MPAKTKTPKAQIAAEFDAFEKEMTRRIVAMLSKLGEECANEARKNGSYRDDTGNLRSSVGYLIAVDGSVQKQSFTPIGNAKDGDTGVKKAEALAHDVVKNFPHDIVLILVAGMECASYVANRGYDVLDSAEMWAKKEAPKKLKLVWK